MINPAVIPVMKIHRSSNSRKLLSNTRVVKESVVVSCAAY